MKTSAEPVQGFRPSGATLSARSMSWCGPESPPPPCPCLAKYLRAWNAVNDFPARISGIARGQSCCATASQRPASSLAPRSCRHRKFNPVSADFKQIGESAREARPPRVSVTSCTGKGQTDGHPQLWWPRSVAVPPLARHVFASAGSVAKFEPRRTQTPSREPGATSTAHTFHAILA